MRKFVKENVKRVVGFLLVLLLMPAVFPAAADGQTMTENIGGLCLPVPMGWYKEYNVNDEMLLVALNHENGQYMVVYRYQNPDGMVTSDELAQGDEYIVITDRRVNAAGQEVLLHEFRNSSALGFIVCTDRYIYIVEYSYAVSRDVTKDEALLALRNNTADGAIIRQAGEETAALSFETEEITVEDCTLPNVKGWEWKTEEIMFFFSISPERTAAMSLNKVETNQTFEAYAEYISGDSERYSNSCRITNHSGHDVLIYDKADGSALCFFLVKDGYYYDFALMTTGGTVVGNADYEALREYIAWNIRFN